MGKGIGILAAGAVLLGGFAAWAANAGPTKKAGSDSAPISTAERLVREALAAELAGDNARRAELLAQALEADPNCRAARWQSGYVNLEGKWLTPSEAAQKFSADRSLAEYRRRRDAAAGEGLFARASADAVAGTTGGTYTMSRGTSVGIHRSDALSPAAIKTHADLARWCRTKQLADEERAHWTQILLDDPSNSEAEAGLGLKMFMGSLMTNSQIEAVKKQRAEEEKALAEWKPNVARWRKSLEIGSESEQAQALAEIQQIADPAIIPALEWGVFSDSPKLAAKRDTASRFQRQAIALLGRLPQQRATYSLTGYSVLAPQAELRSLAADELKKRPLHDFVPILLSGLANPIRFDYAMSFDPSLGVATYHSVASQEGPDAVRQVEYSKSATGLRPTVKAIHSAGVDKFSSIDFTGKQATKTQITKWDGATASVTPGPSNLTEVPGAMALARQGQFLTAKLESQNARIEQMNQRIDSVLERVAPQQAPVSASDVSDESEAIPDSANAKSSSSTASTGPTSTADHWWNWWADYNESPPPYKQVISAAYSDTTGRRNRDQYTSTYSSTSREVTYNRPVIHFHPDTPGNAFHCFAAGNLVTTATGPVAIEKVQIGDRVLAQNPSTGELAFKPVLATSKSPPAKLLRVTTSRGTVRLTLGHSFWTVGKGWRMAKELCVGDRIHAIDGYSTVTAIESQPEEPVYNLTVADFGTFLIGDGQFLVHDNTVRLPSRALLPGFAADDH
jgi:hypothetical protein